MATRFLFNETLWEELQHRVPQAKHVRVAVAYLGTGAAHLLPLKKGDRLVADMSLRAVRSGTTDPREIKKYLRKGVEVFSRGSLHAKFFIIDQTLIAGSSNISGHAKDVLDEAAVLSDDPATIRRATAIFDQLCNEPVRTGYLEKCLSAYRPPRFVGAQPAPRSRRDKVRQGKLWIIGGLVYRDPPEDEATRVAAVVKRASKKLLDYQRSEVSHSHFTRKYPYFSHMREGDWVIECIRDGAGFDVSPPARFLGVDSYPRGKGKRRYLLLYEVPIDQEKIRWSVFRRAVPASIAAARSAKPRTQPIVRDADADALLRLWDSRGHFRPRRKR